MSIYLNDTIASGSNVFFSSLNPFTANCTIVNVSLYPEFVSCIVNDWAFDRNDIRLLMNGDDCGDCPKPSAHRFSPKSTSPTVASSSSVPSPI